MFFGRDRELELLKDAYDTPHGSLVVVYGRRRIGKSSLIKHFAANKQALYFEGLERQMTSAQIEHFTTNLKNQLKDQQLLQKAQFANWTEIFDYLTSYLSAKSSRKKLVLVLDEFQWLAASQSKLVALLKFYWDNHWKDLKVMIVLCGSIASFMVKKVVHSKALYGRVSLTLCLEKLLPKEARNMLSRRSEAETLKYLMILGGVPRYLEAIDQSKSFDQNIENLFFKPGGYFTGEFEKIFHSHFREPRFYLKIVTALLDGPKSMSEISTTLKAPSGGGLSDYLENLSLAGFVRAETPFLSKHNSKIRRFRIADEYLMFFGKFLRTNQKTIEAGGGLALFRNKISKTWHPWLGLAFESYCMTNALVLSEAMGFREVVLSYGNLFSRGKGGHQIDLLFERSDNVITLCEIKYHNKPIDTEIIPEVLKKSQLFKLPRGFTLEYALISPSGATPALLKSKFFHHVVDEKAIFAGSKYIG